ncbi:glycosyltransferase family 2 protein, partial [Streptomyces brasiliscabiei]
LDKCLQSICNQTYSKIEIILVNDGSTDNSERIMEKWSEKDDRIIILHQENSGLSAARNKGLDKATGDWIVFVDSDDFISDNYVLKLLNSALINDADLVICQYDKIDQYNKIHQIIQSPSGMYNSTDFWSLFYSKS